MFMFWACGTSTSTILIVSAIIVTVCGHQKMIDYMDMQVIQGSINRMIPIDFDKPI